MVGLLSAREVHEASVDVHMKTVIDRGFATGLPNGSLAKLQAGSHAKATRRGSCRANHCF
jgi:hypothetical protein